MEAIYWNLIQLAAINVKNLPELILLCELTCCTVPALDGNIRFAWFEISIKILSFSINSRSQSFSYLTCNMNSRILAFPQITCNKLSLVVFGSSSSKT